MWPKPTAAAFWYPAARSSDSMPCALPPRARSTACAWWRANPRVAWWAPPYLEAHGIDLDNLSEPLRVFSGTAREGAAGFSANLNVAAALGLAGIGLDRTELEI